MEITAQIFGIVGMICNIILYQQKTQKWVLIWQIFASTAFLFNYMLLGAMVGCLLNGLSVLRAVVFLFKKKTKANHIGWLIAFIITFVATYPLTFLVFGTEPTPKHLLIEVLPIIAMIVATVSLRLGSAKAVRFLGLFSSPLWLIYNCFSGSIGAVASEIFNLISMVVGIFRLDIGKKKT